MLEPDIDLIDDERRLFGQIDFAWDVRRYDNEASAKNSDHVAKLVTGLLDRGAIPEHRLKYFTDPDYRTGRVKGSRRDLFLRQGRDDDEILHHYSFLKYARYFICGPDLPTDLMQEFREAVKGCGQVSSDDTIELGKLARNQVRAFTLASHESAEEYFKLALDCGIWVCHALRIEDRVRKMR